MLGRDTNAMIDLHGLSAEQAKAFVLYWLASSVRSGCKHIRFVTGRGNHASANGQRGVLYKNFLQWVEESAFKELIERCVPCDGYFEVYFKSVRSENPFMKLMNDFLQQSAPAHVAELKKNADKGDPFYQHLYGLALEKGEGVQQDFKAAAACYKLAADQEFIDAVRDLGRCYLHGIGVKQSDQEAFVLLKKAADLGDVEAMLDVGERYREGLWVPRNPALAIEYYKKAAKLKNVVAIRKIAFAHLIGDTVEKNSAKAFQLYKIAADLGDAVSQYNVGANYHDGLLVEKDEKKAMHYFMRAAESGDPDAQYKVAENFWLQGDEEKALFWWEKSSLGGSAQASYKLLAHGDQAKVAVYLERAAQSGSVVAKYRLSLQDKKDLTELDKKALLDKAAESSLYLNDNDIMNLDQESRFFLLEYMLGHNKEIHRTQAINLLEYMADQRSLDAMKCLIRFHSRENKKDTAKIIELLQKLVDLKDPDAMCVLAQYYQKEENRKEFLPKALALCESAAKDFYHPHAYFFMGVMHMSDGLNGGERVLPSTNMRVIRSYFEDAIKYEQQDSVIEKLGDGVWGSYKPIAQKSRELLGKINSMSPELNVASILPSAESEKLPSMSLRR